LDPEVLDYLRRSLRESLCVRCVNSEPMLRCSVVLCHEGGLYPGGVRQCERFKLREAGPGA